MPVVQDPTGRYYNIKLSPGEQLAVQKQYAGAGKIMSKGDYLYSFIVESGNSATIFLKPEVSALLAPLPVGTKLLLNKEPNEGLYGKVTATLADGSPIPSTAPPPVPTPTPTQSPNAPIAVNKLPDPTITYSEERPVVNRDQSIAWQNANNAAATIASQVTGSFEVKKKAFKLAQEGIYESYLEEFMPAVLKQRKLIKEAEGLFGKDDSPSQPVQPPQDTSVPFLDGEKK